MFLVFCLNLIGTTDYVTNKRQLGQTFNRSLLSGIFDIRDRGGSRTRRMVTSLLYELAGFAAAMILTDAAVLIASGTASRESLPALNPTHPA